MFKKVFWLKTKIIKKAKMQFWHYFFSMSSVKKRMCYDKIHINVSREWQLNGFKSSYWINIVLKYYLIYWKCGNIDHFSRFTGSVSSALFIQSLLKCKNARHLLSWLSFWENDWCHFQFDRLNRKRRKIGLSTLKQNCPAHVSIREICKFPEFKVGVAYWYFIFWLSVCC